MEGPISRHGTPIRISVTTNTIPEARAFPAEADKFEVGALAAQQAPTLVLVLTAGAHSGVNQPILVDGQAKGRANMPLGVEAELLCT